MDTNAKSSWALKAAMVFAAAGVLAVLYVLFVASSKPEPVSGLSRFATGEMHSLTVLEAPPPLPSRTLTDAAGGETTLQAFSGEVLVVNLWATWCAPCMEEMPTLGALQRRFEGRVRVIPISVDSLAARPRAQQELAQLGQGSLPFYTDMTRGVLFDAQAAGMPVTIIYDRHGAEVARLAGGADWSSDEAAALMDAVLAGEGA